MLNDVIEFKPEMWGWKLSNRHFPTKEKVPSFFSILPSKDAKLNPNQGVYLLIQRLGFIFILSLILVFFYINSRFGLWWLRLESCKPPRNRTMRAWSTRAWGTRWSCSTTPAMLLFFRLSTCYRRGWAWSLSTSSSSSPSPPSST